VAIAAHTDVVGVTGRWLWDHGPSIHGLSIVQIFLLLVNILALLATRKQLILNHPPRLRITNPVVWAEGANMDVAPVFRPGAAIEGFLWAVNFGRETARLLPPRWTANPFRATQICRLWWGPELLPMCRPYNGDATTSTDQLRVKPKSLQALLWGTDTRPAERSRRHDVQDEALWVPAAELAPGWIGRWIVRTKVPEDHASMRLYLLGYIFYWDRHKTRRGVLFAYKYDSDRHQFIPMTDNPDYWAEE
jgi:hypothetical protein